MVVVTDLLNAPLLSGLRVQPGVVTPNGDGINDAAQVSFTVYRLTGTVRFAVGVYDLAGRLVRDLSFERANASGEHGLQWDGRDDGGSVVVPGIYLLRVHFEADADEGLAVAVPVHVVY